MLCVCVYLDLKSLISEQGVKKQKKFVMVFVPLQAINLTGEFESFWEKI